jgi:anti-sigma factor RsiW
MSSPEQQMHCPTDETLAAYIDGRLSGDARARVEEHLVTCDACHAVWQGVAEFRESEAAMDAPNVVRGRFGRRWAVAAAAAAVIVVSATLVLPHVQERRLNNAVVAVAAQMDRPSKARFSGPFSYRPAKETPRGGDSEDSGDTEESRIRTRLLNLWVDAQQAVAKRPSAGNLHAAGVAALYTAEKRDERAAAVQSLEDAVAQSPSDAALLNDLAAARIAWGSFANDSESYERAAQDLNRAWAIAHSPEIAWNRAVVLDKLRQREKARIAWNEYLKLDPTGPWADEVRAGRPH